MQQLKERRLVKDNLRVVKNFGRFYSLEKFAEIGNNLAKTIINAGLIEILRSDAQYKKILNKFYKEMHEIFLILSSKSARRRLKKILKKQTKKFNQTGLFVEGGTGLKGSAKGVSATKAAADTQPGSPSTRVSPYQASEVVNYYEDGLINEDEKLHHEDSFKGQEPTRL